MPLVPEPREGRYDDVVIGGGFFGCSLATKLARKKRRVLLLEEKSDFMQRASFNNQARVHQGYHYPRHFLTAVRSRVNFPKFVGDYRECIVDDFEKYYAIARRFSKTNANQFFRFISRTGAPIERAPEVARQFFNPELVEEVFRVQEYAFDSDKLKAKAVSLMLDTGHVDACLNARAISVSRDPLVVAWSKTRGHSESGSVIAERVYNCTYSKINDMLIRSKLTPIQFRHELTEMCLVDMANEFQGKSVTVMCGPFFSAMPFPPKKAYTLSHVRYTPHSYWLDHPQTGSVAQQVDIDGLTKPPSNFVKMVRDAARYLPLMSELKYLGSLWEIKTTLPSTEINDGRPILCKSIDELPGLTCIMGGKIDNIYDVYDAIEPQ
jgi:glycine/D-amino acid oxidase-like deaminating enzyme